MNKIEGIIFDLDGVIVDTAVYHFRAWKKLADEMGFSFTEDDNERLKGVSRMESLRILLEIGNKEVSEEEKKMLAEKKNKIYVESISGMGKEEILPGVMNFIQELKEEKIPFSLGSASKNAPLILKNIGLYHSFDAVVDGNDVAKAKPAPQVFLLGAEKLQVNPEGCIVFEDAQSGIEAAKAAGMFAVAVGEQAKLKGADYYITSMEHLTLADLKKAAVH
ncbi:beta-phosphoglucomutase [Alkalicoccus halolimnae]|uniref:Beta-phosphoglucomutase n=1 Tax=Alkalicoccus halolimnae TaxID=1667239 RepID=A0A5C7FMH0_9BACI|nr:beta-phosphoglucomutase [Alkalicoccus halolimnae]TXF87169.1 beta-phosphoglucomutase [Alkalicoccus halolimnae]